MDPLDLAALPDPFVRAFGDDASLGEWFARLLHGSLVATVTDSYEDFASIGRRALDAVAARRGGELEPTERDAILAAMLELPAHPDVPEALSRLRSAGFLLATLTNSSFEAWSRRSHGDPLAQPAPGERTRLRDGSGTRTGEARR